MEITIINKNYIIPLIENIANECDIAKNLFHATYQRTNEYISNVYVTIYENKNFSKLYIFDIELNSFVVINSGGMKIPFNFNNININNTILLNNNPTISFSLFEKNETQENNNFKKIEKYSDISDLPIVFNKKLEKKNNLILDDINNTNNEIVSENISLKNKKVIFDDNCINQKKNKITIINDNEIIKNIKSEKNNFNNDKIIIINDNININDYNNNNNNVDNKLEKQQNTENLKDDIVVNSNISKKELIKQKLNEFTNCYLEQLTKNKKMKEKINNLNNKLEKLETEKNTKIIANLRKLRDEYFQYKKIIYRDENFTEERDEDSINVPNIFVKKYDFIKNACSNIKIKNIFERVLKLDIENLFYSLKVADISNDILLLNDSYYKMRKDLHIKFSNDYDYLEEEMTVNDNTI
jgi:hypothetical protein